MKCLSKIASNASQLIRRV